MKLIIPNFWRNKSIISSLLHPLSLLYRHISSLVSHTSFKNIYIPKAKVITVGNITMGGAGKTPVALSLAQIYKNHSKAKIAILTRGYKGSLLGPVMADHSHSVKDIGDEAILLAQQSATCISKNRLAGIKFLEELGYEIIITDDGFQDQRFKKSLSILVVDTNFGFGNHMIFPAGPLRQSIDSGVKKANLIVLVGKEEIDYKFDQDMPIFKAKLESKILLGNKKFIAFAGIGNPDKFFQTVVESEGNLIKSIVFADHHNYTKNDLDYLINLSNQMQANLITTEKDYTKIDEAYKDKIQVLPVNLIWNNGHELLQTLLNL
ncbi:MAG: tetraacyldisaccharide 4'-kinase [Rickettsiales bacterium]